MIDFPVQLIRFIRLRILSPNPFEIAEIQAFGTGFVPKGTYLSKLIELPTAAILGALSVKATKLRRQPDGVLLPTAAATASVDLTLRNGTDETPLVHFEIVDRETGSEQPTTADAYAKLAEDFRGSILDDAENWTWKNPIRIDSTGTFTYPLELPGPRKYFDFQLFFRGTSTDLVQIDSLAISYSLPLADRAVGEVAVLADPFPPGGVVAVPAGRDTLFTYDIRAEFGSDAQVGFDGLHIATQTEPTLLKFEMGEPLVEVVPDSVHADAQGLMLYFPSNRITPSNNQPLRVTFRTAILVYATDLVSHLIDSGGVCPSRSLPAMPVRVLAPTPTGSFSPMPREVGFYPRCRSFRRYVRPMETASTKRVALFFKSCVWCRKSIFPSASTIWLDAGCVSYFSTPCLPEPTSTLGMAAMRPVSWCLRGLISRALRLRLNRGKRCWLGRSVWHIEFNGRRWD